MELAVRGGASSTGRMVRLKVCFEDDRSILTPQQVLDGLSASWFVARPDSRTIADLVTDIAHSFNLSMTCPHGIFLQMENFTLPPLQPIWLLKDKDIVIVKKKSRGAMQSEKLGNCSSLGDSDSIDKKGTVGVKSRAIEEFEKEIGGYESEEEEEDGGEIPSESLEAKTTTNPKSKAKKKKRRKQKIEGCPTIRVISIPSSGGVTDSAICQIAKTCPQLEELDVSECQNLTDVSLEQVGLNCKHMKIMKRNRFIGEYDPARKRLLPQGLSRTVLPASADREVLVLSKLMPNLKQLELRYSKISDHGLAALVDGCTKLEYLDLVGCSNVTRRALDQARDRLPNIKVFLKSTTPVRAQLDISRYGHWQLYDERFQSGFFQF